MRTTIELPDELYRTLKTRAAYRGIPMRELVQHLLEQGLRSNLPAQPVTAGRRTPPPVIIAPRGVPIKPLSRAELKRIEEEEDAARHARSA